MPVSNSGIYIREFRLRRLLGRFTQRKAIQIKARKTKTATIRFSFSYRVNTLRNPFSRRNKRSTSSAVGIALHHNPTPSPGFASAALQGTTAVPTPQAGSSHPHTPGPSAAGLSVPAAIRFPATAARLARPQRSQRKDCMPPPRCPGCQRVELRVPAFTGPP